MRCVKDICRVVVALAVVDTLVRVDVQAVLVVVLEVLEVNVAEMVEVVLVE